MKRILVFVLLGFPLFSYSQSISEFKNIAENMGLLVNIPNNVEYVKKVKQDDVLYNIAFKYPHLTDEYRIALYPPKMLNKELLNKTTYDDISKDIIVKGLVIGANITQDPKSDIKINPFTAEEVKNDFNADAGEMFFIKGNSNFSNGFEYVLVNIIYKRNVGMVVLYYLVKDVQTFQERFMQKESMDIYYSIKFK